MLHTENNFAWSKINDRNIFKIQDQIKFKINFFQRFFSVIDLCKILM